MKQIGQYTIDELIRESALSKVYKAHDQNGNPVILKTATKENIQNEVNAIQQANSARVIKLLDYQLENENPYLITENAGTPLNLLERKVQLAEAPAILQNLFSALHSLHKKNLTHGDLKPGNVLYDDGELTLCDLAGARDHTLENTLTKTGALTFGYIPPEVERGEQPTPPSDMYQAGLIMYELYAGQPLRPHSPPIEEFRVPPENTQLFKKLISPNPKERPTAKQAYNMLKPQPMPPPTKYELLYNEQVEQNKRLERAHKELSDILLRKERPDLFVSERRRKKILATLALAFTAAISAYTTHIYHTRKQDAPTSQYWFQESASHLTFPVNLDSSGGNQRTIPIEPGTTAHLTQLIERAEVNDKQAQSPLLYDSARNIRRQTYTPSQVERILYTLQDENGVITQERVRTALRAVRTTNQGYDAIIASVSSGN